MSTKTLIWTGLLIGSTIGGFLPALFGMDLLSYGGIMWGILGSTVGGIGGIYLGYRVSNF